MNEEPTSNTQSYTLKELAVKYRTTAKIFRPWLKKIQAEIGPRIGHYYNPKQVRIIFDHLGAPFVAFAMMLARMIMGDSHDDHHDDYHHPHDDHQGGRWRR